MPIIHFVLQVKMDITPHSTATDKSGGALIQTLDPSAGSSTKHAMCRPVPLPWDPSSVASHLTSPKFRTFAPAASNIKTHLSIGYTSTTPLPFWFSAIALRAHAVGPFFFPWCITDPKGGFT